MLSTALIEHILTTIPNRTVGVLGDLFLDRYLDIDARLNEPSVETGLTAYQITRIRCYPGAAGTVINNLAALGVGRILPIAYIGDDGEGYELRKALPNIPGVVPEWMLTVSGRHTPTYTKPMLNEGEKATELNRLDAKNRTPTPRTVEDLILGQLDRAWPLVDALIVLDQVSEPNCGVVTQRVRERLAELAERDPGKFVLADSREQIARFRNVFAKPNEREICEALPDTAAPGDEAEAKAAGLSRLTGRTVFLTRGAKDIFLTNPSGESQVVRTYPVSGPIDIVGAGDSCSAGITSAIVSGATPGEAAAFGNLIASITIQQIGVTGTASPHQVRERWKDVN